MQGNDGSWVAGTLTSLGPMVSLLIPFLRSISRRYRIETNAHFCELLSRRRQAEELLTAAETERYPGLRNRISSMIRDIDRELTALEWNDDAFRIFILLAAVELALFSGAIFAGAWNLRAIIIAKSWESGVPFFEGIFQPVAPRVGLFMVIVIAAALVMKAVARKIEARVADPVMRIAAYMGLFNALLLAGGLIVFEILVLTDPISPYW